MAKERKEEEEEHIFRSRLPDIKIPQEMALHRYCMENMREHGWRRCLINAATGKEYSYSEVEATARRVASGLKRVGVGRGDVIMLLLPNCPEFVFTFLGASRRGAITTAANPFFTPSEIAKQAEASRAKLLITQASCYPKLKQLERLLVFVDSVPSEGEGEGHLHFSELAKAEEEEEEEVICPEEVVALPYSSGTTGVAKGVMLTHRGLVTSIAQQVDGENPNLYYRKDDVVVCVLPLFHIYSLNSVLLCSLRAKASILLVPKFEICSLLSLLHHHRVTIAPVVPPILLAISNSPHLHRYDLSSIRFLKSGGAPLAPELHRSLTAKFPNAKLAQVSIYLPLPLHPSLL